MRWAHTTVVDTSRDPLVTRSARSRRADGRVLKTFATPRCSSISFREMRQCGKSQSDDGQAAALTEVVASSFFVFLSMASASRAPATPRSKHAPKHLLALTDRDSANDAARNRPPESVPRASKRPGSNASRAKPSRR